MDNGKRININPTLQGHHTTIVIITSTLIVNPMNGGDPARDKNLIATIIL